MLKNDIFEHLTTLLDTNHARYRVMEHATGGKSEEVAKIRGTHLGQGAKALVCHVKGNNYRQYILAILPADQQADLAVLAVLAKQAGGNRASLASPKEVSELTRCVFGAIPPFSFHPDLKLIADPLLFERYDELAFNAGSLERSIILNTKDYRRIAMPELIAFRKVSNQPDLT
ncbi:YbaK/prolyl-tRNA synthetase associated domain-containing protein [Xenorhabdus sp. PB61.4]|uniref:YbaK/prolyl-tRNA synthetase associated domain-containing protein n=1 Tax=Xenorhabdus sp. PB61.4 TaxID=2788940 RepID=UPI001E2FDD29|nr:YbaK/prolyl-tRNA synthetase associated domain-containing protein [Xenorhabdus sp. PB61.4]